MRNRYTYQGIQMSIEEKGTERRQFIRITTWLDMTYSMVGSQEPLAGLTRNVSAGGIGFFTKTRLVPGTVMNLELKFPKRTEPLRFTGEVTWSGPLLLFGQDDAPHAYETGVRILKISPEDQEFLTRYRS